MSLVLYYYPICGPCRSVLMTAEAIGLTLEYKSINVLTGENLTSEYEQLNPMKTIPFLVDGDFKLTEGHAIMPYLVDKYGNNERLYPKSPAARALVDQRLHYDVGTLFKNIVAYYFPVLFRIETEYNPVIYAKLQAAFETLDRYLDNQDYVTGRNMTIADFSMISSVTTAGAFDFEISKYKNVEKWIERMRTSAPGYAKVNTKGVEMLKRVIDGKSPE